MSREVSEDFGKLVSFFENYSYAELLSDSTYVAPLKIVHRHHLALMTVLAELTSDESQLANEFVGTYGEHGRRYLIEVGSDCSEHIVAAASGLFRAAGATLRSSIESFCKALSVKEFPDILTQTSVPKVFEIAESSTLFSTELGAQALSALKGIYADLNHFVHTVASPNILGAHSAGKFPYMSENTGVMSELFSRVVREFLMVIVGGRRDLFDQFDHRNKVIVASSLTRPQRRLVFGQIVV